MYQECLSFAFQLLDKLWSQVSFLLSPGTCLQCSAFPLLVHCHRTLRTHALVLSASQVVHKKKVPQEFIRVRTRGDSNSRNNLLIIAGTRTTCYLYEATGSYYMDPLAASGLSGLRGET